MVPGLHIINITNYVKLWNNLATKIILPTQNTILENVNKYVIKWLLRLLFIIIKRVWTKHANASSLEWFFFQIVFGM